MGFARFSIFTSMERNAAIIKVRDAIQDANGWVVEQTFFSNIASTINFELPATSLNTFQDQLRAGGLTVYVDGDLPDTGTSKDVRATISLTFSHDEPDLKRQVPPFG